MSNIIERYNELKELANKVKDSTYTSTKGYTAGIKYVNNTLYKTWRIQVKAFIAEHFKESSVFYKEFEKAENGKGFVTNKNIFGNLLPIFDSLEYEVKKLEKTEKIIPQNIKNKEKVFIVHGHEELAISQVSDVLIKLKLKPIILRDQPNKSNTIIEKIEEYTNDVGFGIILYTECDVGGKDKDTLQKRARQNVVLEHGYLMARLGRKNTCALVKGKVETPGDISGVVYMPMDEHKAWQYKLIDELKAAGYSVSKDMI